MPRSSRVDRGPNITMTRTKTFLSNWTKYHWNLVEARLTDGLAVDLRSFKYLEKENIGNCGCGLSSVLEGAKS